MGGKKVFIRTTIGALILLTSAIIILSITGTVPGYYQLVGDFITINPNAPGTKLYITLTIHYIPDQICFNGFKAGPFFMRIRKGNDLFAFGGNFQDYAEICWDNSNGENGQEWALDQFMKKVVFPVIFYSSPDNPPPYALKSYSQLKQDYMLFPDGSRDDQSPDGGRFAILDAVIAVKN